MAFEIHVQLTQAGFGGAKRFLCPMPVSDVDALDKNRGDIARPVLDRLANEIHIAGFCGAFSRPLKDNFHILSDKRFSRCEGAIEQFNEALLLNLRNGLASR